MYILKEIIALVIHLNLFIITYSQLSFKQELTMRIKRTQEEWQSLFAEQRASELSVAKFCQQYQIPVTTFYNRRATIKTQGEAAFCKATVIKTELTQTQLTTTATFEFESSIGKFTFPVSTSPEFLAQFIKGLSS